MEVFNIFLQNGYLNYYMKVIFQVFKNKSKELPGEKKELGVPEKWGPFIIVIQRIVKAQKYYSTSF